MTTEVALITMGAIFVLGLVTDLLARRTGMPRVTLLVLLGLVFGPSGLGLLPGIGGTWFPFITNMALAMVGFLLGGTLTVSTLRRHGREVLVLSLSVAAASVLLATVGLWLIRYPLPVALVMAGIATSTDAVATLSVIREARAHGGFAETLRAIVAVDDAWGLIAFSLLLVGATSVGGAGTSLDLVAAGIWEILGGLGVGVVLGLPMAYLTARVEPGEPTQAEALGMVLLTGGIALWLDVSFLLAAMTLGAVVANFSKHHRRPFHAIEGIEWPFMILFFVLSGASVDVSALAGGMELAAAYVILRIAGRLAGGLAGARLLCRDIAFGTRAGLALLPQSGLALGMALMAHDRLPATADAIIPAIIGASICFELAGPVITRRLLVGSGDAAL